MRVAPKVDGRDFVDTGDRTVRRAGLEAVVSLANVIGGVVFERDPRIASLLGAVVHESVFANV